MLALISVLERINTYEHEGKYQTQLAAAKQLMQIFAQFRPKIELIPVPKAAFKMWSGIRTDAEHADVELLVSNELTSCSDLQSSSDSVDRIKAHRVVLCQASPVLKASLASEMQEGRTHVIPVPEASTAAVEALLSVIYSGKAPELPPCIKSFLNRTWAVGDPAEGNYHGRGTWWPCTVTWVHPNGKCDIAYDAENGAITYRERRVDPQLLQARGLHNCHAEVSEHLHTQRLALDIAHRWQIGYAVDILEHSLSEELRRLILNPCFADIVIHGDSGAFWNTLKMLSEASALYDLPTLSKACKHVARETGFVE